MEKSLQILKDIFARFVHFLPEEWAHYEQHLELLKFRKKAFLTREGDVEEYIYFIVQGSVRQYFVQNTREICLDFGFQHNLISAYESFLTREPSSISIQAITDVKALRIHVDAVQQSHGKSKNSERLGRLIAEQLYMTKLKREMTLLSLSAEEKYRHLMEKQPDVIQVIPVKYIASYLGIHPESLSRIRKHISLIS